MRSFLFLFANDWKSSQWEKRHEFKLTCWGVRRSIRSRQKLQNVLFILSKIGYDLISGSRRLKIHAFYFTASRDNYIHLQPAKVRVDTLFTPAEFIEGEACWFLFGFNDRGSCLGTNLPTSSDKEFTSRYMSGNETVPHRPRIRSAFYSYCSFVHAFAPVQLFWLGLQHDCPILSNRSILQRYRAVTQFELRQDVRRQHVRKAHANVQKLPNTYRQSELPRSWKIPVASLLLFHTVAPKRHIRASWL